jgi:hypothetical protein
MNIHRRRRSLMLLITLVLALTGCGSSTTKSSSLTTHPPSTPSPPTSCGQRTSTTRIRNAEEPPVETVSAVMLGLTIEVDARRAEHPRCVVPSGDPPQIIHLQLGDRIAYVANDPIGFPAPAPPTDLND